ncbi:redoxin domain-containing protein, partial [Escherichia coli]
MWQTLISVCCCKTRAQDGEQVNLTDFQGQRVLVYFYPKAMTPGCTVQACGLRDNMDE